MYHCVNNFYSSTDICKDKVCFQVRENLDQVLNTLLVEKQEEPPTNFPYFKSYSFINKNFLPQDTSDAVTKARLFYESCMDENRIQKRGNEPLRTLLKELGSYRPFIWYNCMTC